MRAYLQELKGCLPGEAYRRVVAALQQYKRDGDREALVGEVVEVLKLPGRCHLLPGLARFLPRASQGTFLERVRWVGADLGWGTRFFLPFFVRGSGGRSPALGGGVRRRA